MTKTEWADTVRKLLLQVWGEQACRRPEDWPDVLKRLLQDAPATPGGSGYRRSSLAPTVDAAVTELALIFPLQGHVEAPLRDAGTGALSGHIVWRCFPKLDRAHATQLAALLIKAAAC